MPPHLTSFLSILVLALGCGIVTWLAMHCNLIAWRRRAGQHWTIRARLLWTARLNRTWIVICVNLIGISLAIEWKLIESSYLTVVTLLCGVILGLYPSTREIEPRFTFPVWLRFTLWILFFQFGLIAIGMWLATTMPQEMDLAAWLRTGIGLTGAIILISGIYLPLISRLTPLKPELKPVYQRLKNIAEIATKTSGVTPRHIWLANSPIANAVAFPIINAVVFTTRTMELLDDDECLSVMYHEYGHLRESWSIRLMRILPTLAYFVFIFVRPISHAFGIMGVFLLIIILILIQKATNTVMRRMEHRADDLANSLSEHSPVYARALEKLHEASQIPAVMAQKNMTHPDLYDRMVQAGLTPSFEPPLPPQGITWAAKIVIFITILTVILVLKE